MSDDQAALAGFGGVSRLFPLPNVVLFPHVVQTLHIFEPRYRQMTADAIDGDGLIALVGLKQGWEDDFAETPEVEAVGCLGRITQHEKMADGRYNLRLRGVCRVRVVEELRTDKLYRTARAELVPDVVPDDVPKLARLRKRLAEAVLTRFEDGGQAHRHLAELFQGEMPLGVLCDMLAYALPVPVELKQRMLEQPHVDNRAELLVRALDATTPLPPPAPTGRKFPPDFSPN
jgi:Lon protease-like protein